MQISYEEITSGEFSRRNLFDYKGFAYNISDSVKGVQRLSILRRDDNKIFNFSILENNGSIVMATKVLKTEAEDSIELFKRIHDLVDSDNDLQVGHRGGDIFYVKLTAQEFDTFKKNVASFRIAPKPSYIEEVEETGGISIDRPNTAIEMITITIDGVKHPLLVTKDGSYTNYSGDVKGFVDNIVTSLVYNKAIALGGMGFRKEDIAVNYEIKGTRLIIKNILLPERYLNRVIESRLNIIFNKRKALDLSLSVSIADREQIGFLNLVKLVNDYPNVEIKDGVILWNQESRDELQDVSGL